MLQKLTHLSSALHSTGHHNIEPMDVKVSHRLLTPAGRPRRRYPASVEWRSRATDRRTPAPALFDMEAAITNVVADDAEIG